MADNEPEKPDDSDDFDQMVEEMGRAEAKRRRRGMLITSVVGIVVLIAFALVYMYRDDVFGGPVDVGEGEAEILAETNDPQCRQMIDDITAVGDDYFAYEKTIDQKLLGDDAEAIRGIRQKIDEFEARLTAARELSRESNLRFEDSPKQLTDWFEYMELELGFVDRLARERLAELEAADAAANADAGAGDAGAEAAGDAPAGDEAHGEVVVQGDARPEKTPVERRDAALVAIHDAFENFRVWHAGGMHPCGKADPGETPWAPPGKAPADSARPATDPAH